MPALTRQSLADAQRPIHPREFIRKRSAAQKLAAEYFQALPEANLQSQNIEFRK
jgi:hypothetical protein